MIIDLQTYESRNSFTELRKMGGHVMFISWLTQYVSDVGRFFIMSWSTKMLSYVRNVLWTNKVIAVSRTAYINCQISG